MPLVRSSPATVSEGWAPCSSQWRARSSSNSISDGLVCGLYWPIVAIVRPSRGERLSATTMRQIGFFLEPTRLSLIRTAMSAGRLAPTRPGALRRAAHLRQLLHVGHLAAGHRAHHHAHLVELLDQLIDVLNPRPGAVRDAFAARALDDRRIGALGRGHREDDRLDPVQLALVDVGVLQLLHRPHPRHHPDDPAERAHLADLAHLLKEVLERELVLAHLLLQRLGLL